MIFQNKLRQIFCFLFILLYYLVMNRKKYRCNWIKIFLRLLLLPFVLIWLVKRNCRINKNQDSIDIFNISQIDSLNGQEFENLLKIIFEKQGYEVALTKKSHDYGADLVLRKNKVVSVVQAKCYDKNIGIKAVQEIISAKLHYKAEEMFVATNRYFSKDAIILASEHNVKLIDRDVIIRLIRDYAPQIETSEKKYVATNSAEKTEIEARYKHWI